MILDCLLTGVGGQGTVLASKLLAQAAIEVGFSAQTSETIGMAQRGGSVSSHVRIGKSMVSPVLPKGSADIIIAFEPAEAARNLSYLKTGGTMVVSRKVIKPITAALEPSAYDPVEVIDYLEKNVENLVLVDAQGVCESIHSPKSMNIVMLAYALKLGLLPFSKDEIIKTVMNFLPEKIVDINIAAIEYVFNS